MNEREVGEIRRRTRRDRSNMTTIYGCYVSGSKEILSEFSVGTGTMSENEAEKYFALLKRTLSGAIGKNLIDISFTTAQVAEGAHHKFLMELRKCKLSDDSLRMELYRKILENVTFPENFLILLGCDTYDVPFRGSDEDKESDGSGEVYTYLMCAVCPVKLAKPNLRYTAEEKMFHDGGAAQVVAAPETGFLFPAFDDRRTNIYNALFYTHSPKQNYENLVNALFAVQAPKSAHEQKESFQALLTRTLDNECSLDAVQTVYDQLRQSIVFHKESRVAEPLTVNKEMLKQSLTQSGISEKSITKFGVEFDEAFGADAQIYPKNIIDNRNFRVETPDVTIQVNPERTDLIETRVIGGVKYLLICADENVQVNGVNICIQDD